jgi:hypothetical protein
MMNWPDCAAASWLASSGVAASASLAPNSGPNTWFIATNDAAMPAAV